MNNDINEKLYKLYMDNSKHSNYQSMPEFIESDLNINLNLNYEWRGDKSRYRYIKDFIKNTYGIESKIKIIDIGANTGYFSLNFAYNNHNVTSYEVNENHCNFINEISKIYNLDNEICINKGIEFDNINNIEYGDIIMILNVLHHAGIDFDKNKIKDIVELEKYIIKYIKQLKSKSKYIVLQIGYNWGGNKQKPIINPSNPLKMISFIKEVIDKSGCEFIDFSLFDKIENKYFSIMSILDNDYDVIKLIDKMNIKSYSEFYKRPLIIIKSR